MQDASIRTLKAWALTLLLVAASAACSLDPAPNKTSTDLFGTRNYKLDPEANAIELSIYGVAMGTPDTGKFQFLMRALKASGEFTNIIEKNAGIEGGITICGSFAASARRDLIYELIRSIETDPKSTNFSASSVEACSSDK